MTVHSCRIAFFDAKPYDRDSFNSVNEREFHYDIRYFKGHLTPDSVPLTRGTDVACIFVNDTANREVIRNLKENGVKLLALRCAGFNNVDLKAAEEAELPVVRVPQYSPYAVAEHAVALMLSLNRKIHRAYWRTRDGNFSLHGLMGFDMNGKTAGIIGTGKIARILIRILKGFGMNILAYDLHPDQRFAEEAGITYTTLDDLYARSDIISLHCPLTPETEHLINTDSIGKMKDGVMIINTGRGKLINTEMLIDGLKSKKVGAAGLDVYEEEGEYFYEDKSDRIIDDDTLARLLSFNNVDIIYANEHGIKVTGIRDYGDEGVVEYVISELVRSFHGFGQPAWEGEVREITGLKAGIIGLGKSGGMIADALRFFGAEISYFARSEKEWAREKGYRFLPLDQLLEQSEAVFCCLNKNTVLLHEAEFRKLGDKKILFNTGLSPAWDEEPFVKWLSGNNLCFCDTVGALGGAHLLEHPHVRCVQASTGRTRQAFDRLSEKVLANLSEYNG